MVQALRQRSDDTTGWGRFVTQSNWLAMALMACTALTACGSLPRSAALQSEIIAQTTMTDEDGNPVASDFGVVMVTRATVPGLAQWPRVTGQSLPWPNASPQAATRRVAPGDTLKVTIWTSEENSLLTNPGQRFVTLPEARVSSSGTVFLPYVGNVRVGDMAPETAREQIEAKYLEVTPSAQVQVEMSEGRLNTASLVSGVNSPGSFPLTDSGMTVTGLIAQGGGVPASLHNPQVRLQRGDTTYGIAMSRLIEDPSRDATLRGGDRVFVVKDERTFIALGASNTQSLLPLEDDETTALEALALMGGMNGARANPQGMLVLRHYPQSAVRGDGRGPSHDRMVFTLDLTSADGLFSAGQFQIAPDDLVYVTESPVNNVRTVMGLIGSVFGLRNQIE